MGVLSNFLFFQTLPHQTINSTIIQTEIVGIWQYKTAEVSSALLENFQFFNNGNFIFNTNSYNDLNPLRSISGSYILQNNILKLKVIQVRQRVGYKILEADHGFQSEPFQIKGGNIFIIEQNDTEYSEHEIKFIVTPKGSVIKSIKIDEELYFKLSADPNKFTTK